MASVKQMRLDVKKYIDTADENMVKVIHALLEGSPSEDWWKTLPEDVKMSVERALLQADRGQVMSHEAVRKKYEKWFTE